MDQDAQTPGTPLLHSQTTRRQFLRRAAALATAPVAVSLLAACGGGATPAATSAPAATAPAVAATTAPVAPPTVAGSDPSAAQTAVAENVAAADATAAAAPTAAPEGAPTTAPAATAAAGTGTPSVAGKNSADAAVAAAQQFKGTTLNVLWEAGLQAQDPLNYSGPKWEELTGIKINTIEKPFTDLYSSQVAEHVAGSGAYDVLQILPAWQPDFVIQGIAEPLDGYIDQYMNKDDLDDYHPLYRDFMNYGGKKYGLFDDGDMILIYYRKDLFNDAANKADYKAKFNAELAAPKTWEEYDQIQGFFTEKGAGQYWGGASQRAPGQVYGWFLEEFRNRGGKFFDENTMDGMLNSEAGQKTLSRMVESNKTMPPGVEAWGFVEVLNAWMAGQLAMVGGTWPPFGRWSEGYGAGTEQLKFVPPSKVAGNVGYSVMPMGHSEHNAGFLIGVAAGSKNKEAAYLFCQWANSPTISLERCMLPYALRDPFRLSHFSSEQYRGLWPAAGEYLDTLKVAADGGILDIIMPGSAEYHDAVDKVVTAAQAGTPTEEALQQGDAAFNGVTDRIGRDKQKAAYAEFLKLKGAYPA